MAAHNSLRHPTPTPPPSPRPHPTRAGPQISVQTLGSVQAAGSAGHTALCWPQGCPAAAALPPPHGSGSAGFSRGSPRPAPAPAGGELPVLLSCRYCPLKTTPRRSFPRPQSEAASTCLPEFSVSNSLFKWGLHLAWKVQKGHPNSLYHGGPALLPAAPAVGLVPGACVCGVQTTYSAYPPSQGTSQTGSGEARVLLASDKGNLSPRPRACHTLMSTLVAEWEGRQEGNCRKRVTRSLAGIWGRRIGSSPSRVRRVLGGSHV